MGIQHRHSSSRTARLVELEIFSDCNIRQLRLIDRLGTPIAVPRHRVLCRQGDIERQAFVVVSGFATVTTSGRLVGVIGKGEVVGEIALRAKGARCTGTVVTVSDMQLIVFNRAEFTSLLAAADTVARKTYRQIAERMISSTNVGSEPTVCGALLG